MWWQGTTKAGGGDGALLIISQGCLQNQPTALYWMGGSLGVELGDGPASGSRGECPVGCSEESREGVHTSVS